MPPRRHRLDTQTPFCRAAIRDRTITQTVGHRRVWLPDRVVELRDSLVPAAEVGTTRPTCGITWAASSSLTEWRRLEVREGSAA